jgi:hypothetical protein
MIFARPRPGSSAHPALEHAAIPARTVQLPSCVIDKPPRAQINPRNSIETMKQGLTKDD